MPKLKRSNKSRPCPVCGGQGCGQREGLVLCWRTQSDQQAASGAWIHPDPSADGRTYEAPVRKYAQIASIEHRDRIYNALLGRLGLNKKHYEHLREVRGLSHETIKRNSYATVEKGVKDLASIYDLRMVPGFYYDREWKLRFDDVDGFYIPLRDVKGRIQALQIKLMRGKYYLLSTDPAEFQGGACSGAPAHYVRSDRADKSIVITEGGLKADVIAEYMDACVIGLVACGSFDSKFGWNIRNNLVVRSVGIAYDADWKTNDKVANQLHRLDDTLKQAGINARILTWSDGKGLDDYLLRRRNGSGV